MDDSKQDKAATPLLSPLKPSKSDEAPRSVDTDDAPVSTDADGKKVDLPDLGGQID